MFLGVSLQNFSVMQTLYDIPAVMDEGRSQVLTCICAIFETPMLKHWLKV
jgi:hypothetical protein